MTKVDRVGPMFKGKTPPVGEDKHRFHKGGLKGQLVVLFDSDLKLIIHAARLSHLARCLLGKGCLAIRFLLVFYSCPSRV